MLVREKLEKHYKIGKEFLKGESLEKYYLMGRLLVDGYIDYRDKEKDYYRWCLISREGETLRYFAERMDLPLYYREMDKSDSNKFKKDTYDRYRLGNARRDFGKYLYQLFGDYKSKVYKSFKGIIDKSKISAFLTGYLDGDGSVSESKGGTIRVLFLCAEDGTLKLIKLFLGRLNVYYSEFGDDTLRKIYVSAQGDVMKLRDYLYNTEVGLDYKKDRLNKVSLSDRMRNLSKMEKKEILKELEEKYNPDDEVDFDRLSKKYNITKGTIRKWFYHEVYDLNGKSLHAKRRERDENGRFI